MPASNTVPRIIITAPSSAAPYSPVHTLSYAAMLAKATRAPHRRSPLRKVTTISPYHNDRPSHRAPAPRASRPAPAPPVPVAVAISLRRTGEVLDMRVPVGSTLDQLRSKLDAGREGRLVLEDDGVEGGALESHFHAFLARARRDGEPLRLVLLQ
ncbi:hypothetical protein EXIGLDRAFT_778459 [Exidia glandulosa HHB12029]|uniref:Uncharacterized protein n=1 Tax=Exidia glandulosa HHB12029 TaxID=1314781 RepID=A0A165CIB9_EXIGL|nr:hypothetical protein EXIGLDRAFT_778459 [Exidia glandulosa HHB12029]